jgi:hypothetical protein
VQISSPGSSSSHDTRQFWLANRLSWEAAGFLSLGSWERHFVRLGDLLRLVCRIDARPIFETQSLDEQLTLFPENIGSPLVFVSF